MMNTEGSRVPYLLIPVFIVLSVGIGIAGYIYYINQKEHIRHERQNELSAIADLKVRQIIDWRKDLLRDAATISNAGFIASRVRKFIEDPKAPGVRQEILSWMKFFKEQHEYRSILLLDTKNDVLLTIGENKDGLKSGYLAKEYVYDALSTKKVVLSDFHISEYAEYIHLDLVIPLFVRGRNALPVGALMLRIDPYNFLYPLIQTWPTPSHTSETLLVRREGDDVLFLNELRHRKNTALSLRIPVTNEKLPAAMAVRGQSGVVEGIDYRGISVLAALRAIPDSPWFLNAKVDTGEIYAPIRKQAAIITVFVGLMIVAAGVSLGLVWRQQLVGFYRKQYESECQYNIEREQTAATLKENEAKFRGLSQEFNALLDAMPDSLTLLSPDLKIIWANKAAAAIAGKDVLGMVGQYWYALRFGLPAPDDKFCPAAISFRTGDPEAVQVSGPDGRVWDLRTVPIKDAQGKVISVIELARDITEHRKLEDQLRQAQKMEAVGQLAGGIAHDFNNILTAIIGYGNLLQMKMDEDGPLRTYVDQMLASSERAANLTQSLLTFSRKQIINPRPVNLNNIIKGVEKLLLRIIGETIEFKAIVADETLTVMADSGQIEQALINLCTNARDAMPRGGLLTIETGAVEIDEEFTKAHAYGTPGVYAVISVADTGGGLDEKTRQKIFEPFFTTKEMGKGTGLGLSIVYGIIKQHNGYINVYSELGKGTTFRIYLPLVKLAISEEKPVEVVSVKGGTETIMVGEDDAEVRKLTKTVLEEFGYRTIEAVDGEDVIEKFNEDRNSIKLIILDIVMPKKSGREAYEEIRKIAPDMKVIFTSGYTADLVHKKKILEEGLEFISKPVSPRELLKKVRDVLDR